MGSPPLSVAFHFIIGQLLPAFDNAGTTVGPSRRTLALHRGSQPVENTLLTLIVVRMK